MDTSQQKTKELLLYVAERLKSSPNYGATLLNKALYFIDNISYVVNERPISILTYVRQDYGPTPNPQIFLPIREALLGSRELEEVVSDYFGRKQKKYIPTREPNLEFFEKEEIKLIDDVLAKLESYNASDISNFTHSLTAWKVSKNMEELPFYTFLLSSKLPCEEDIKWAKEQIFSHEN